MTQLETRHSCPSVLLFVANQVLRLEVAPNRMRSQPTANSSDSTAVAQPVCTDSNDTAASVEPRGAKSLMVVLSLALVLIFLAAAIPAPIRAAWDEFSFRMQLPQSEPQSASPGKLSDHEIEEVGNVPAQQPAERWPG